MFLFFLVFLFSIRENFPTLVSCNVEQSSGAKPISPVKGGYELTIYTAAHQQCTSVHTEKFTLHFMHRVKNALRRMWHIFDRSRILSKLDRSRILLSPHWTEVRGPDMTFLSCPLRPRTPISFFTILITSYI